MKANIKQSDLSRYVTIFEDWLNKSNLLYSYIEEDYYPRFDYIIKLELGIITHCFCHLFFVKDDDQISAEQVIEINFKPYEENLTETMKFVNLINMNFSINTHLTIDPGSGKIKVVSRILLPDVDKVSDDLMEDIIRYPSIWTQLIVGDGLIAIISGFCKSTEALEKCRENPNMIKVQNDSDDPLDEHDYYRPHGFGI